MDNPVLADYFGIRGVGAREIQREDSFAFRVTS
jgi:hypothetical protein